MRFIVKILILLIACLFFYFEYQHYFHQARLPSSEMLKSICIQGTVSSVPVKKTYGIQFQFKLSRIENHPISKIILLNWYRHPPALMIGEKWQLYVRLKPPLGLHNPNGFDYGQWLIQHKVVATGYVITKKNYQRLAPSKGFWLLHQRFAIENAIKHTVSDNTLAAVLSALSVGMRNLLQQKDWKVFQRTGTSHLVAISGLHIGLVAGIAFAVVKFLWRRSAWLLLSFPAIRAGQIASVLTAFLYTALSGFALPAQRALVMLLCLLGGELLGYKIRFSKRLLAAFIFVICLNPFSISSASCWLSFFAVAILGYISCARLGVMKGMVAWGRVQLAITIALFPITLWFFQQMSLVSVISNAVAIPWIGFFIVPTILVGVVLYFLGCAHLSAVIFKFSSILLKPLWIFLQTLSGLSFASWQHTLYSPWLLILSVIGVFILLLPKAMPGRWLGCFGFLPLFFYHPRLPDQDDFWVTVLDVGQGLSVVIQTAKHVLIYDTGMHVPQGFDAGASVVMPFLSWSDIHAVDRMIISHGDNDHSGGAASIFASLPVKSMVTSAPKFKETFHGQFCHAGQSWEWDGVHFDVLSPSNNLNYQDNNSSCVVKITNKAGSILLTGDIEKPREQALLKDKKDQLQATVLVVPHHGSRTSSSASFLKAVSPRYAVISLGAYNRYHFPSKQVMARLKKSHINVYTTAKNGAIKIRFLHLGQVRLEPYLIQSLRIQ